MALLQREFEMNAKHFSGSFRIDTTRDVVDPNITTFSRDLMLLMTTSEEPFKLRMRRHSVLIILQRSRHETQLFFVLRKLTRRWTNILYNWYARNKSSLILFIVYDFRSYNHVQFIQSFSHESLFN